MKAPVAAAALLGLAAVPGASGQSWRPDPAASCGLVGCEGTAEPQETTDFDGSGQRSLHETDDANDIYDTVSSLRTKALHPGKIWLVRVYSCHA